MKSEDNAESDIFRILHNHVSIYIYIYIYTVYMNQFELIAIYINLYIFVAKSLKQKKYYC